MINNIYMLIKSVIKAGSPRLIIVFLLVLNSVFFGFILLIIRLLMDQKEFWFRMHLTDGRLKNASYEH